MLLTLTLYSLKKTLKNLSVSLRLPHLIRPPSASESVEYTALNKFFFDLIWIHDGTKVERFGAI